MFFSFKSTSNEKCYCCGCYLNNYSSYFQKLSCCKNDCYYILHTLDKYIINKNGFYIYHFNDKTYRVGFLDKIEIIKNEYVYNGNTYHVDDKYLALDYLFELTLEDNTNLLEITNSLKKENLIFI